MRRGAAPSSAQHLCSFFFTHRRLRTRLFMQVGDERRTNGKNFFHPSHRSFLPLSYETPVRRRRRRRKNYVYYLVVRGGKYTCCAVKWNSKHHHRFMALFFSAVDKELLSSLIVKVNIPKVILGNTPPSPRPGTGLAALVVHVRVRIFPGSTSDPFSLSLLLKQVR